jgi:hypothetical protein
MYDLLSFTISKTPLPKFQQIGYTLLDGTHECLTLAEKLTMKFWLANQIRHQYSKIYSSQSQV